MEPQHKTARRGDFSEDVISAVKEFLRGGGFANHERLALSELAWKSLSTLIWMYGEQDDIEEMFEVCKRDTLRDLQYRFDHWQAKMSAVEVQGEDLY